MAGILATKIWIYSVQELLLFTGVIAVLGLIYLLTMTRRGTKAISKFFKTLGIGYDPAELGEDEMKERIEAAMENTDQEELGDYTEEELWKDIERLCEEYKHAGKLEERKKGEGSEQIYNMILITMIGVLATLMILIWKFFM